MDLSDANGVCVLLACKVWGTFFEFRVNPITPYSGVAGALAGCELLRRRPGDLVLHADVGPDVDLGRVLIGVETCHDVVEQLLRWISRV